MNIFLNEIWLELWACGIVNHYYWEPKHIDIMINLITVNVTLT